MEQHFRHSSFREKLIEHLFVGELLKRSWLSGECTLEVAKPEVDNRGYDVIVEREGVVRHIQLKASHRDARANSQKVHMAMAAKPSGCVVWVQFDATTLELGPFLYFGAAAGAPMPSLEGFRVARHTKANMQGVKAEKPEHRLVPKARFRSLGTVDELFDVLFGQQREGAAVPVVSREAHLIEHHLHRLIGQRAAEFGIDAPDPMPRIGVPFPVVDAPAWFPLPGMYGGFSYWLERRDGTETLMVESWSRIEAGSGQRHAVTAEGVALLEAGFV